MLLEATTVFKHLIDRGIIHLFYLYLFDENKRETLPFITNY